ncbi:MAG: class I SAM-dependent methyltransferase [Alphaproteobacteria bacterium]|nr:class I SAM-dependent methyltransferase [Alphaproteobacteria bacterium]
MQHSQFVQEANTIAIRDEINLACSGLHQRTLDVLADMYGADKCYGTEIHGPITINKDIGVSIEQGARMHNLMRSYSVKRSLEVGFGYGFSTVWMLDALRSRSNAFHLAIDPWEKHTFHGIGLAHIKRLGFGVRFEWIENFSIHALSDLIRERAKFDFIFIDGIHRFDDVIVNFYLSDQILQPGGLVVFDDMWLNSVRTATNFIINNRSYEVVPQPFEHMLVLRKTRDDNRDWNHFNSFEILGPSKVSNSPPPRLSTISNGIMRVRRVLGKISRPGGR